MSEASAGSGSLERLRSKAVYYWPLALLTAVNVFYYVDRYVLYILIEPIRIEFGLSDGQIGLLTGVAFAVSYAIVALPMGWRTDTTNRVRLIAGLRGIVFVA